MAVNENREEVSFAGKPPNDVFAAVTETQKQFEAGELSAKETATRAKAMRQWLKNTPLHPTIKTSVKLAVTLLELKLKDARLKDKFKSMK